MSCRIRGHYRIDAAGRVESIGDVNASLLESVYQPPIRRDAVSEWRGRLTKTCVAGASLFCIGLALMAGVPEIQRMMAASETARMASIRRVYVHDHPGIASMAGGHFWHRQSTTNSYTSATATPSDG